jgi:hypothetical protein
VSTIKKKTPKREAEKLTTSKRVVKESSPMSAAKKNDLPDSSFAFVTERKEPLIDAPHVRNAVARFMQVRDVSDVERDRAWRRIRAAAKTYGVEISEKGWRELTHQSKSKEP